MCENKDFLSPDEKNKILGLIKSQPKKYLQEAVFKRCFYEMYEYMEHSAFPEHFTFQQRLYHYLYDDIGLKLGRCEVCGKRTKFVGFLKGYLMYCSRKCSHNSLDVIEKTRQTNLERYGVDNPAKNSNVKQKMKNTNLGRYGCSCSFCNDVVKEKVRKTNIDKYGYEYPIKNDTVKQKMVDTNKMRYGREFPLQNDEIKEKAKQTNLERYGVDCVLKLDDVRKKSIDAIQDSYAEIQERIKQTNLEKYGCEYSSQNDEIKEKAKQTNLERYGVEWTLMDSETSSKIRQTNLERYGVEYPFQSNDIQDRCKESVIKKYGVGSASLLDSVKDKTRQTNLERYGVPWACMRPEARSYSAVSKVNLAFAEQLSDGGVEYEMEFPLGSYSYDFKVGDTLVEINPTITHNSFKVLMQYEGKDKSYHLIKTACATDNGYRCIHIWDWDDTGKIISTLKPKQTLYARKLTIQEVNDKESNDFLNAYHLQNTCKGQSIRLGLYTDDMLVELMTFGKPRYNRNYEYELLRLCSQSDYIVVGGAERLFKYFVEHYNPQSIISYCDASKFDGGVYERLGFRKMKRSAPTKHWCNPNNSQHITDNLLRQRGFDQLFGTEYGKGTSNDELMLEHGFLPVYDCGQIRFEWKADIKYGNKVTDDR